MELKYVNHDKVGFVLWPRTDKLFHSHVGGMLLIRANGRILSAGFATISQGMVRCHGKSESLGIPSLPSDTEDLAKQLGLKPFKG